MIAGIIDIRQNLELKAGRTAVPANRQLAANMNGSYLIWRFMIDKKYQGKGYGKKAFQLAMDYVRTFPVGEAKYCWLSYEPENEVARNLYASFGFKEAKKLPKGWDEIPAMMKL